MKPNAIALMAVAAFTTGAAFAHTELSATVPANGAMIAEAPENVQLTFSEPVRLTALTIQKDGEEKQSLGPLPSATIEEFSVALPATAGEGHYMVSWHAMSEDTHVMTGEFMFAVGAEGTHDAHMNHENMPAGAHHDMPAGEHHNMPAGEHHDEHAGPH
jgi:copper transport protein